MGLKEWAEKQRAERLKREAAERPYTIFKAIIIFGFLALLAIGAMTGLVRTGGPTGPAAETPAN